MTQRIGWLCTESWAGTSFWRVLVLRETPTRFWVRVTSQSKLPVRGWVDAGAELCVQKHAVTFKKPPMKHALP